MEQAAAPGVDIAVDLHGRTSPNMAKKIARELEPFKLMFLEEPVLPGDVKAMKEISLFTTTPIAAGEVG